MCCFEFNLQTINLFQVVDEKHISPCPFASVKKPSKKKKDLNSFNKDQADVLEASARGSYFKQQKLIALDEEEQNRLEKASWAKIEG